MSHVDEGTLHALLDRELTPEEARAVEAHLEGCALCRAAMAEARGLVQETEVLITDLDEPETVAPSPRGRRRLLPRMRTMGVAATVLIAAGITYIALAPGGTPSAIPSESKTGNVGASRTDSLPAEETRKAVADTKPTPEHAGRAAPAARRDQTAESVAAPAAPAPTDELRAGARREAPVAQEAEADALADRAAAPGLDAPEAEPLASRAARVSLEVAVASLGGAIRLIDGMTPVRVDTVGAEDDRDPRSSGSTVRVVYQDSLDRPLILEQVRLMEQTRFTNQRADSTPLPQPAPVAAKAAARRLEIGRGDTVITRRPDGSTAVRWIDGGGFLLTLVGVDRDYLLRLIPRVH